MLRHTTPDVAIFNIHTSPRDLVRSTQTSVRDGRLSLHHRDFSWLLLMCEYCGKMNRLVATIALLILPTCLVAQSNMYSSWPNFPQSPNFFPIVVFLQDPQWSMGSGAPYSSVPLALKGAKINIVLPVENGYPTTFGVDPGGRFQALASQGIYFVAGNVDQTGNTSPTSVASYEAMAASIGATQYLIGYNLGDEPTCSTMANFPSIVSTVSSFDSSRPIFWNFTDWVFSHGSCYPPSNSTNTSALQAISIGSFDVYPLTGPWNGGSSIPFVAGQAQDNMWINGWSVAQFVALGRAGQPIWGFVDTGTNELGYSSQNGSSCNTSTNLCTSDNHEYRATAEQVNAEVWMDIINGAMGVEYFCDDTSLATGQTAYNFCLGSTTEGEGSVSATIASNLTYVNTNILSYAPQLNSSVLGRCTMNKGTGYTNYTTSCSNGILSMSTGTSSVPGSAIVKSYNGTPYLFADSDRNGSATMTFTLSGYAGSTATVVYDSNAQYDPAHSSVGSSFTLNGNGQFSDTFGANSHNYQPKMYKITSGGPAAPSGLTATVQ